VDDETKIVEELASKLPKEEVRDYSYPEPDKPSEQFVDKLLPEERLTQTEILDYLQIPMAERHSPIIDDYIHTIYEWARENAQSSDVNQLLRVINEQEMHLGSKLKPDRLRRLAEYVKINKLRQSLAAREQALYG
jgi:hypothetical protein